MDLFVDDAVVVVVSLVVTMNTYVVDVACLLSLVPCCLLLRVSNL